MDGKKPTLFSFLRRAGVKLPSDPKELRLLWDGARDSLLAKFAARFAERDARFWEHALTPVAARPTGTIQASSLTTPATCPRQAGGTRRYPEVHPS